MTSPIEWPEVAVLMARLCEIASPSRHEEQVAEALRLELAELGAVVTEDDAASAVGCGAGNILGRFTATVPGTAVAFCAHMDTVPQSGPIEVIEQGGYLTNRHPTILGSDDKGAVAAMLVALRRVIRDGLPHAGIELLFTPCEEIGLLGAAHFDPATLTATEVFVYDHTGEVGGIVTSAPSLSKIDVTFTGTASHAGISPEDGRSAIDAAAAGIQRCPLGRIDEETTANVGTISGGSATNVVAERCELRLEARSRSEARLSAQIDAMVDAMAWAATHHEVDLAVSVRPEFSGYTLKRSAPQVKRAAAALTACGLTPSYEASGGGSDANAFLRNGVAAVNLCNGLMAPHTEHERVAVADLERMVDVTLAIIAGAVGT